MKKVNIKGEKVERECRICGCTDDDCSQCIEAQGYPCHWVEEDLCSRCATLGKMDFDEAKRHFDEVKDRYKELVGLPSVNVMPAIRLTFEPLEKRFENGERSRELYEEMMSVE